MTAAGKPNSNFYDTHCHYRVMNAVIQCFQANLLMCRTIKLGTRPRRTLTENAPKEKQKNISNFFFCVQNHRIIEWRKKLAVQDFLAEIFSAFLLASRKPIIVDLKVYTVSFERKAGAHFTVKNALKRLLFPNILKSLNTSLYLFKIHGKHFKGSMRHLRAINWLSKIRVR